MNTILKLACALLIVLACACAAPLEQANKAGKEVGKTTGQVVRIPSSVSEGIAEGIAGEQDANPYDR
jgi:hypothetical protein